MALSRFEEVSLLHFSKKLSMVDYIVNTSIPASCYKAVFHRSPWASILYSAPVLPDLQNIFPFKVVIQSYFHD